MKCISFRNKNAHHKNKIAFKQMCYDLNFEYLEIDELEKIPIDTNLIWSDNTVLDPISVPIKSKIMFGPGLGFIFSYPQHPIFFFDFLQKGCFNLLSAWNIQMQNEFIFGPRIPFVACPFPVNTNLFKPDSSKPKTLDVLVYFKQRDRKIYNSLPAILDSLSVTYKIIVYGKYKEEEYIQSLNSAKLVLWVGCHESQGFAFQEALSMNVPILCYDVKTMFEEYGFNGHEHFNFKEYLGKKSLLATSATYWDERCGEKTWEFSEIPKLLRKMLDSLDLYSPREFVLEKLTSEACWKRWAAALEL